jgi:hypothetical protein
MVEALGSVSASEAYQEFEKRNNRFVNMLTDNVSYYFALPCIYRIGTSADRGLKDSKSHSMKKKTAR